MGRWGSPLPLPSPQQVSSRRLALRRHPRALPPERAGLVAFKAVKLFISCRSLRITQEAGRLRLQAREPSRAPRCCGGSLAFAAVHVLALINPSVSPPLSRTLLHVHYYTYKHVCVWMWVPIPPHSPFRLVTAIPVPAPKVPGHPQGTWRGWLPASRRDADRDVSWLIRPGHRAVESLWKPRWGPWGHVEKPSRGRVPR